ncbi:MAG: alpha/beta fold hydrolase [Candidatus Lokiarchaeia archaeon]|nr:alpha/beta fold hydrolase [Candidatus Lokiarchaeia archaeon]
MIIIDILISWYIWEVNVSFGNPCYTSAFSKCFTLSVTTFLIIYVPFEIYWSFRDLWFDRWRKIILKDLNVSNIKIKVSDGALYANIVTNQDKSKINLKNSIIIVCHGFSDTKETLQYLYFPFAYQGYVVLAYDARGTGKSKKTGRRSDFLKRIEDFCKIIEWVRTQEEYTTKKIYCIGFSIGATTVLSATTVIRDIDKIIAISSMSSYKQNIPKYNPVIILDYLIKGVKLFPNIEENIQLSPYQSIKKMKDELNLEEWRIFSNKIMLIHCRNDRIIKFKNLKENRLILESSEKNILILKKGGHSQKKNECILVGACLNFFNS